MFFKSLIAVCFIAAIVTTQVAAKAETHTNKATQILSCMIISALKYHRKNENILRLL